MENFRDLAIRHLVDAYAKLDKELSTCIFGGTFKNLKNKDGELIHYAHIFEKETDWPYNLLQPYRAKLVEYLKSHPDIDVHTSAHHLDSSQMMCMNFFYPLMEERKLVSILKYINPNIDWGTPSACFEFNSPLEMKLAKTNKLPNKLNKPTNFDFYIETDKGYHLYFEIKYTENDFGKPQKVKGTNDYPSQYDEKFNKVYNQLIPACIDPQRKGDKLFFLSHYQLMRNLVHLQTEKDYVIFLVPQKNPIIKHAREIRKELVSLSDNCKIVEWEDIIKVVENDPLLHEYYAEFKKKYLDFE